MKTSLRCSSLLALTLALAQPSDTRIPPSRSTHDFRSVEPCSLLPIPETAVHHYQAGAPNIRVRESRGRQGEASRFSSSQNWSGYAVETSLTAPQKYAVTSVAGRWTIPTVTASTSAETFSSIWVGIDGYSDGTVEQLGTEQDWTSSGQQNYVWFEMYPHGAFEIVGFPIAPNCYSVITKYGDYYGPMIVFTGDQDNANPSAPCHEMMKKKRSTPIQLIEYQGANHGFLLNQPSKIGDHGWTLTYNPVAEKDMMQTIISAIKAKKFKSGIEARAAHDAD